MPGVAGTVQPDLFMQDYDFSRDMVSPHRIIFLILLIGPNADWTPPHGRR